MKQKIVLILSSIAFLFFILILLEIGIRFLFPHINHQGTQLSLFQERSFGNSVGWKPNEEGVSFGQRIKIDENGFRKMASPAEYNNSWIILGDSVTFGVGVGTENTFAQLLQNKYRSVKIWNTGVVGYSIQNYKDVMDWFLGQEKPISKVLLIFCINDIYSYLNLMPMHKSFSEKTLFFLRRSSKLYMMVKNLLFDRSKAYAINDINLYSSGSQELDNCLDTIAKMSSKLDERKIEFIIILLPYEFQIRTKNEAYLIPQKMLTEFLKKNNLRMVDTYDYFIRDGKESKEYYLYADAMHLSELGHRIVFEAISDYLSTLHTDESLAE